MKLFINIIITLYVFVTNTYSQRQEFIGHLGNQFIWQGEPYQFIGCNYWYGGYLYADVQNKGKDRLTKELDFLSRQGVTNLRVFLCGEGNQNYPYRIYPSLQEKPGMYNATILESFDYFLQQASQRNMKLVIVLNNNWEWSGGFGQYLEWYLKQPPPLPKTKSWDWDAYCRYISRFYDCQPCQKNYQEWVRLILNRKNKFTQTLYKDDPTIMAWELANEPRPMTKAARENYVKWIQESSTYIKQIDSNHMVTIGSEGIVGTQMDSNLFLQIHDLPNIDYATIHIWPKIWRWYNGQSDASTNDTTLEKTKTYIRQHAKWVQKINKPMVIEEFGLARDQNSFSHEAPINHRNSYFQAVFKEGIRNKVSGFNFWGYAGVANANPNNWFWQKGQPYSADPPQEEQGLFSVFETDSSTWHLIHQYRPPFSE